MKIKPVDVTKLTQLQVGKLLAMGESTQPLRIKRREQVPVPAPFDDLDEPALKTLLADLQSEILASDSGPLSFARICGISTEEAQPFAGKTYLKMLTSSRTSQGALEQLASFGQTLGASRLPASTCLAGTAIRALARLALHTRFGLALKKAEVKTAAGLIKALAAIQ